jgi:hypothetical protein
MLLLREPFWLLFLTAFIGLLFGRMKGRPGWGFLLGLFFGPLGLALTLLMPARRIQSSAGRGSPFGGQAQPGQAPPFSGGAGAGAFSGRENPFSGQAGPSSGSACPRCAKSVGRSDKTCSHCGNVLMPIRYEVRGPDSA